MLQTPLIKGLTLTMFISLIIGFILYRSGRLLPVEKELQSSHNGGVLTSTMQKDTVHTKESKQKVRLMLPSSKVAILVDENVWRDSMVHKKDTPVFKRTSKKVVLESPASEMFIPEAQKRKIYFDSLYQDTSSKTKKKK